MKPMHASGKRVGTDPARTGACGALALGIACAMAASPARAVELPDPQLPTGREAPQLTQGKPTVSKPARDWRADLDDSRFYRDRLLPRMERQFDRLAPYRWAAPASPASPEWLLFRSGHMLDDEVSAAAQRSVERAARRAVEDYLLEETALRVVVAALDRDAGHDANGAVRQRSRMSFGMGISHGLPELEMRTTLGGARVGLDVGATGEVSIKYHVSRTNEAYVRARFDPERSRYTLTTRFSF